MPEVTVTADVVNALANKLDQVADQFSDEEKTTLMAVFGIAGKQLAEAPGGDHPAMTVESTGGETLSSAVKNAFSPLGTASQAQGMMPNAISVGGECITWTQG